jgi:hypothetical protein
MTVLQINETRPAALAGWTLTLLLAAMPMGGCFGGPSVDPRLEAQRRELSKQTIETGGFEDDEPQGPAADELDDSDAGMDDQDMTPAPLDNNPQPAEPAPTPAYGDDSVRCGNGVLDDDEICEIALPEGEPGACPSGCSTDECNPEIFEIRGCWSVCLPAAPAADADCD